MLVGLRSYELVAEAQPERLHVGARDYLRL